MKTALLGILWRLEPLPVVGRYIKAYRLGRMRRALVTLAAAAMPGLTVPARQWFTLEQERMDEDAQGKDEPQGGDQGSVGVLRVHPPRGFVEGTRRAGVRSIFHADRRCPGGPCRGVAMKTPKEIAHEVCVEAIAKAANPHGVLVEIEKMLAAAIEQARAEERLRIAQPLGSLLDVAWDTWEAHEVGCGFITKRYQYADCTCAVRACYDAIGKAHPE